ncbi:hypothetical protein OROHE_010671 [Orobanche hederae]
MRGLPASSFLLGCLVGGLVLATLADSKLGRKNVLILACLIMSISGGLTAISKNIWMYAGLRFITGFARSTIGTCAFVLASELVGKKWRGKVGIIGFSCFTLGFLSLPIIAFLLRGSSRRFIYIYTCCPCVCYTLLVWLLIKGRRREFVKIIRSLTQSSSCSRNMLLENFSINYVTQQKSQEDHNNNNFYSALKMLLKRKWAFKRLVVAMIVGFGNGMAYYGSPLGLGNLPFNLYISVACNALTELVAAWLMALMIGKLRRKIWLVGLSLFSGICSVVSVLVMLKGIQIGMELLYFFGMCMAFDVSLIYASELFPTSVRNSAVSMVREAGFLGGFLGPMVVAVGRKNGMLIYGVFGVTVFVTALFVIWLRETKGRTLCDTMEEEEDYKDGGVNNCVCSC